MQTISVTEEAFVLPDKLFTLVEQAKDDMLMLVRQGWQIDMGKWIGITTTGCTACLGGCYLLGHYRSELPDHITTQYLHEEFDRIFQRHARILNTLDNIRSGLLADAIEEFYDFSVEIHTIIDELPCPSDLRVQLDFTAFNLQSDLTPFTVYLERTIDYLKSLNV